MLKYKSIIFFSLIIIFTLLLTSCYYPVDLEITLEIQNNTENDRTFIVTTKAEYENSEAAYNEETVLDVKAYKRVREHVFWSGDDDDDIKIYISVKEKQTQAQIKASFDEYNQTLLVLSFDGSELKIIENTDDY